VRSSFVSVVALSLFRYPHWAPSQIQIRSGPEGETLRNEAGEETSHLQGLFYRTINMLDKGIKPVFVFDGKPPELKKGEVSIGNSSDSCSRRLPMHRFASSPPANGSWVTADLTRFLSLAVLVGTVGQACREARRCRRGTREGQGGGSVPMTQCDWQMPGSVRAQGVWLTQLND
jgi:hypothetical protein